MIYGATGYSGRLTVEENLTTKPRLLRLYAWVIFGADIVRIEYGSVPCAYPVPDAIALYLAVSVD
jgi:short subunit dehydrogenase-like uncharacterized protein